MGLTAGIVGVSSGRGVLLALDQDAAFKPGSCTNQGDQMDPSHRAPADLGGLDELEHHGQDGGRAARVTGDLRAHNAACRGQAPQSFRRPPVSGESRS